MSLPSHKLSKRKNKYGQLDPLVDFRGKNIPTREKSPNNFR